MNVLMAMAKELEGHNSEMIFGTENKSRDPSKSGGGAVLSQSHTLSPRESTRVAEHLAPVLQNEQAVSYVKDALHEV